MVDGRTASFPETDSAETEAVTIFRYLLDTDKVKFDANTRDKIPAVDGDLYLVDEDNNQIKGKLLAQVKKLPDRNRDSPKKRFKIETLNHYTVDPAPFLLVVVDIGEEIAYWRHVNSDFVEGLDIDEGQITKTIHFSGDKAVDSENKSYIGEWQQITEDRMDTVLRDEDYREAYEELREKTNPAVGREQELYRSVHTFLDKFNRLVNHDIPILNRRFYGNAWKIGLALQEYGTDSLHYGLYPIPWERNDVQIKEVEGPVLDELDETLVATGHSMDNPIRDRPEKYAREKVHGKVKDALEDRLLIHGVNRVLAREFIFEFVDEFHDSLGLEDGGDVYRLEDLKYGFYQYLPFWIDEAIQVIGSRGEPGVRIGREGIDLGSLQSRILPEERQEMDARIQERMEQKGAEAGPYPVTDRHLSPRSFEEFLAYLEQRGINKVERLYIPPDYSRLEERDSNWIWGKYSPEDVAENIDTFFTHLPEAFEDIVEANFTGLSDQLSLFGGASKVIVTYEVSENYKSRHDAPSMGLYYLNNDEDGSLDIVISHEENSRFYEWQNNKEPGDMVEINGTSYKIEGVSYGAMDFLYHELPMLNYIYKQLGRNIGDPLNIDKTIFAGGR